MTRNEPDADRIDSITDGGTDADANTDSRAVDADGDSRAEDAGSVVGETSRRDVLKLAAGTGAAAAGLGTGLVGSAAAEVIPTPPLHVDGNLIKDPDGATVNLRGVNMADPKRIDVTAPARGKNAVQVVDALTDTSQDWYSRAIRIPVQPVDIGEHEPGEGPPPVAFTESQLETYLEDHLDPVIQRCMERGAYAIIDYHRHRDITWDDPTLDEEVRMFWEIVAPRYADMPHVMYEVFNEPTEPGMWGDPTQDSNAADVWRDWKATAQPWVDIIRDAAPNNLILIGSPSWTQSPEGALVEPFDGNNLVYTYHIYPGHGVSAESCQCWDDATMNGEGVAQVYEEHPLFVTEFGWEGNGGRFIGGTDTFGDAFLEWLEQSDAIHWTAWIGDPVWRPVMFERPFTDTTWEDNIGNPYETEVPTECSSLPCEWSVTTGSSGMGDDIKQALIDHRNDNPPTVEYDEQAPPAPSDVTVEATTEVSVDVSWSPVTDNGDAGLSHYALQVDGTTVSEVPAGTTSGTISELEPGTTYTIGVVAVDRVRNESSPTTVQATTGTFDDATPPSVPANLSSPENTWNSVTIGWDASTDEGDAETAGLDHYDVLVDGQLDREVPPETTQVQIGDLDSDTTYEFGVRAVDRAGNASDAATISVTTDLARAGPNDLLINDFDGDPPWPDSNDLGNWVGTGGLERAEVVDGALEIDYDASGWYGTGVSQDVTDYPTLRMKVSGENGGEERGIELQFAGIEQPLGDVATGTIGTAESIVSVDLAAAEADLASPGQLTFRFYDAGQSSITIDELWLDADEPEGGDSIAPAAPSNLASPSQAETSVEIEWDAATDEGGSGLDHYNVYVDGGLDQQVAAGTTATTVEELAAGTAYEIGVAAVDGAGNESAQTTIDVTTAGAADEQSPTVPENLTATDQTASSVDLSWDPSTDEGGSGLDGYVVYLGGSEDHTVAADATSTTVDGLDADTSYEFGVSAIDAVGNESDTATVSATTDGGEPPSEALIVNDYDGSPGWPGSNDLGNWTGAGSFANGDGEGEVVSGALELEYQNAGWFVEQVMQDVSDYDELVFEVSGASGGEGAHFTVSLGGARGTFADLADGTISTSTSAIAIDLADAGVNQSSPGELRLNFWEGASGSSTLVIEEIRFE